MRHLVASHGVSNIGKPHVKPMAIYDGEGMVVGYFPFVFDSESHPIRPALTIAGKVLPFVVPNEYLYETPEEAIEAWEDCANVPLKDESEAALLESLRRDLYEVDDG